ncbi:MAG: hypothetical protein R6V60_18840 [Desulfobacterales bacterium]
MRTPMAIHFIEESEIVSSILKALKKLEDDNPPKGRSVIWPSGRAPRRTIRRWDISSGWSVLLLWGMLAVVLLISVGGLLLYLLSPAKHDGMPAASVAQLVTKPIQESPPPEVAAELPPPPPAAPPPQAAPPPTRAVEKPAPPPAVKKIPAETRRAAPPASAAEPEPDRSAATDLPVLTTDLKLQAISWAPLPGHRLAVINGNILREGAALEGYVIVGIYRDEVVVRKGSEQWKLVFNIR